MKHLSSLGFRFWIAVPILVVFVILALFGEAFAPYDPRELNVAPLLSSPSGDNLLGTDGFGRDQLSRLMSGARISALVAFCVAAGAFLIGVPIGLLVGYRGGALDAMSGRVIDVLFAFPSLLLALGLATVLGTGSTTVIIALVIVYIPGTIRYVRGAASVERSKDYVRAARLAGASDIRIMYQHILPNISSPLIVYTSAIMAFAILAEAGLSFLGFGAAPPSSSWGLMAAENASFITTESHLAIVPGLAIFTVVLAMNLLGDAFRDRFDPTLVSVQ